jgi:hypothetical protein
MRAASAQIVGFSDPLFREALLDEIGGSEARVAGADDGDIRLVLSPEYGPRCIGRVQPEIILYRSHPSPKVSRVGGVAAFDLLPLTFVLP